MKLDDIKYIQIKTDANERNKSKSINKLKKQIIQEVKNYCRMLNNGYGDFCYQDTINKILFVELQKDLNNINLIFN